MSPACRRNTYLWRHPTNNSSMVLNCSSAADNAIFTNRAQNNECSFGCVALLFNFCEQKFFQHGPVTIAIDCNGLSLLILCLWIKIHTKQWLVFGASAFQCMHASNATILLVYITAKIKMSFIWKDDFFFAKIGIFCKSSDVT